MDAGAHTASHPNHQRIERSPHQSMPDAKRGNGDSKGPEAAPQRQGQQSEGRDQSAEEHQGERAEATVREGGDRGGKEQRREVEEDDDTSCPGRARTSGRGGESRQATKEDQ